ncbi:MAG: DUF2905 domain-containing protein [Elusimicrobia bacterium]|nr:DUF2905 domain-containing protein [Candidatus Liberimonas magnetica]
MPQVIGKVFIIIGLVTAGIGFVIMFFDKIPLVGKLPGDILIRKGNFTFYFPLVTCVVLSIILTVILLVFKHK